MFRLARLGFILTACTLSLSADSTTLAPTLEWVTTLGGSGANQLTAAGADSNGNLYLVGTTASVDLPVTPNAVQSNAGGSSLIRITTATGAVQQLFPVGLSNVSNIAADPENPQLVYAAQSNMVWQSTDAGATWATLATLPATIFSLAVDPFHSNVLYAGTIPQGVYKSTDGGMTWTASSVGIPANSSGMIDVQGIWTDPLVPQVVFVSTDQGFFRSADAGATWTVTLRQGIATSPAFDSKTSGTIYLVTNFSTVVSKSTDDGQSFLSLPGLLTDKSTPNALLTDPFHAGILYAGSPTGIYQTSDGGMTWIKKSSVPSFVLLADPAHPVLYSAPGASSTTGGGILASTDGFTTTMPIGPSGAQVNQMVAAGSSIFAVAVPTTDVFIAKLDSNGNIAYVSYFGGSSNDNASAMTVGADGSLYIAGLTSSPDFPVTKGAYQTAFSASSGAANFVFKLNPDGSLAWSTYFADAGSPVESIAVDVAENVYIGGSSVGNLPTTAGAYETNFMQTLESCFFAAGPEHGFLCIPGPTSAFVTKLNPSGSALIYSTYISTDSNQSTIQNAVALSLDTDGDVYFGGSGTGLTGGPGFMVRLNASGSALLASVPSPVGITAIALDASGNVYAAGSTNGPFTTTPGAFQTAPQPAIPSLPGEVGAGGGSDAFVMKWDSGLSNVLAATLLGGEMGDGANSVAVDASGNVILSGSTGSKAFPTRAPFQLSFSSSAGFVAELDSSLSHLLFSTYLGDQRQFVASAAIPDSSGNILVAGWTQKSGGTEVFTGGPTFFTNSQLVVANKIALAPAPAVRLDSVVNFASKLGAGLAPGEAIALNGAGLGSDAQILIDGSPIPVISGTATSLVAAMPAGAKTSGAFQVQISMDGALSNPVLVPAVPASPGIYSVDGSGYGQGYILNSDGTLNSPSNPAAPNSPITIFATGEGAFNLVGPYAVTALQPSVYIDGFYADGIAAADGPVTGFPGNVFQLSVTVPDPAMFASANPNLLNFTFPPQVGVMLIFGTVDPSFPSGSALTSQAGVVLNVKP